MDFLRVFSRIALPLSAAMTLVGVINVALIFLAFESASFRPSGRETGVTLLILSHVRLFAALFALYSFASLVASVGLVKRRRWAVNVWTLLLTIGIAWSLGVVVLELVLPMPAVSGGGFENIRRFPLLARRIEIPIGIASAALLTWLLKKMLSREVKAAFKAARSRR